jgi:hypothetical protein
VTAQTPSGFTVEAETAGASGGFYWRVVARPKSEQQAQRLSRFEVPKAPVIDPASFPKPAPDTPKKP